jgi:hypothetical protein
VTLAVGSGGSVLRLTRTAEPWPCEPEVACTDGWDDDCDGLVDCADPDCAGDAACEAVEATCTDGRDNDGDGLADCADPDCAGDAACEAVETRCFDGLDNDGDAHADCADPDCLGVEAETCDDGRDNDCDGHVDCDDDACLADAGCVAGGACQGATVIACGEARVADNGGGQYRFDTYPCNPYTEYGPEAAFRLVRPTSGEVTVRLYGMAEDLDLVLLGASPSGACSVDTACLATSATTANERVTFTAEAGVPYYLIVDGYNDAVDTFTLAVECP